MAKYRCLKRVGCQLNAVEVTVMQVLWTKHLLTSLCGRDGRTICGPLCVPKSTYVTLAHKRKQKFFYFGCSLVRRFYCKNSKQKQQNYFRERDGRTDGQTDRQSATQYAAPSYGGGPHNKRIQFTSLRFAHDLQILQMFTNVLWLIDWSARFLQLSVCCPACSLLCLFSAPHRSAYSLCASSYRRVLEYLLLLFFLYTLGIKDPEGLLLLLLNKFKNTPYVSL